ATYRQHGERVISTVPEALPSSARYSPRPAILPLARLTAASYRRSARFLVSRRVQLPCEFALPSRSLPHDPSSSPPSESLRWDSQSGDSAPHTWPPNRASVRILLL